MSDTPMSRDHSNGGQTMNENARKWVEALRSGEFKQARARLHPENGYCCLGVACEIYRRETGEGEWDWQAHGRYYKFRLPTGESKQHLPRAVQNWLGLGSDMGSIDHVEPLTDRNDFGSCFDEIAEVIESDPPGLFA